MSTNFFDSDATEFKEGNFAQIQLPHIKFFDKVQIKNYYYFVTKQKYCLSPFNDKIPFDENTDNSLHLYYNT